MSDSLQPHGLRYTRLPCPSYLLEFAQTHVHWFSDVIQPSHPLSSPSPPASIFPGIRVFSSESVLRIRWPQYWSFSFSISPSSEYSRLISFRMDWFDLLAVQGTRKGLLQHHSLKASILRCSALWSNPHIHMKLLEKPELWLYGPLSAKRCLCFLICCLGLSCYKAMESRYRFRY